MPCSVSQRWRNSRQLGGRESGSKRATKLLIGTSETTLEIVAAAKRPWPGFASEQDVKGLVLTVISVNECDPLRDEGIEFYRLLLRAGVPAQCRQVMGTIHGTEIFAMACPDVSRETAASIARFCREI